MSNQDYYGAGRQVYGDGGPQPLYQVYGQQYGGSPYPPQQSPYPLPGGDYQGGYNTTPHQPGYDQGPPPSHSPYPAPYNEHQRAHSPFPPQGQVEVYGGNQNGGYGAPGPPGDYGVPGDSSGPQDGERGFLGNTVGAAAGGYTGHKLCGGPLGTIGGIIAGVVGANLLDKACDKKKKDKHYCSRWWLVAPLLPLWVLPRTKLPMPRWRLLAR
ncbi:hypothetical protein W97_09163 [Coniosporium apollinis CBS 100218]|uniref:Glycine zipper 2TM domain-containing protein n=1 Tax=Coniosporium apollinis (strain CBS 100218) TaxID=1168221 RepID=R7Z7A4_CONA1|nr:uncharacterized protein W97_09163 [Coniosporium apollinis CBS 100218]EON69899.1 hypothetical protein W97_09163 [Coniosporium apollinis CBS 100218]